MSVGQSLRDLLTPLGIYRWEGAYQWAELQSEGLALDGVGDTLAEIQREMNLATAQAEGLAGVQTLLGADPGARDQEELRLALAALLRIGGDSFTLAAMNDTLRGCGLPARVEETGDPLHLVVSFPGIGGIPVDFERMQTILEAILPCHVWVDYALSSILWSVFESRFGDWDSLEGDKITWTDLENMVV
ncbi:MAG: DUF2313 domain-containing protein [Ruminiclostridium sp.]|nr:DUF2313 domain-containing protein [Ruminiclostridium sp.]